eukprot:TRINITY_DN17661_c0_g1_i1.p1 TRINITY_DN17661_c0_g1~~TRINITY_DN17661_c0_g1_i1.p1  ORF type:complete len:386 (+),score=67.95 TRINITY_DN17661_c0_g1_i1:151-1308(+)
MAGLDEIEAFRARYPMDESAFNYIVGSSPEVQRQVLNTFRPKKEDQDYSALIISFTKRCRNDSARHHFAVEAQYAPPPRARPPRQPRASPEEMLVLEPEIEAFRARFPFDEAAYLYIKDSPADVQREILTTFRPKQDGESDYSALVISFSKRCRNNAEHAAMPSRGYDQSSFDDREYQEFRRRYPFDEDTHNYLQTSGSEVRRYVLQNFRPPREGEPDYSALLITYTKRSRETARHAAREAPPWQESPSYGGRGPPPPPSYGKGGPPGGGAYVDQRGGYDSYDRKGGGGSWNGHRAKGGTTTVEDYALDGFRQRYPMDDRAYEYLLDSSPEVRKEVIETFSPPRQDTDYSAPVVGYAKRVRARYAQGGKGGAGGVPPAKRSRTDY